MNRSDRVINKRKVAISRETNAENGIRMHVNTEKDFKVATRILQQRKICSGKRNDR